MSTPTKYLICSDEEHALVTDATICAYLQDVDGSKGSRWSGVSQKDDGTFAVIWEPAIAKLFGEPKDNPELVIESAVLTTKTVDGKQALVSNWTEVKEEPTKDAGAADAIAVSK